MQQYSQPNVIGAFGAPPTSPGIGRAGTMSNPQMAYIPQNFNGGGTDMNWNFILSSLAAQSVGQGIAHSLPTSQQSAVQRFNREQFSPMNYLPYTPNYSQQDRFGMAKGGMVKMNYGGNPYEDNPEQESAVDFRKWIMDEQKENLPQDSTDTPEIDQQPMSDTGAQDYSEFMSLLGQMGQNQYAFQSQEPMKKGGKVKYDDGGGIPVVGGNPVTSTPEDPMYHLADMINYGIATGQSPYRTHGTSGVGNSGIDGSREMMVALDMFRNRGDLAGLSPQQRIDSFYSMPSNNPKVQGLKDKLRALGQGPTTLYNDTPDKSTQDFKGAVMFEDGGPTTQSKDNLGPVQFLSSYINSDKFKQRYTSSNPQGYTNPLWSVENQVQIGNEMLNKAGVRYVNNGSSALSDGTILIDKNQAKANNASIPKEILPHELSHNMRNLSLNDEEQFSTRLKDDSARSLVGRILGNYKPDSTGRTFSEYLGNRTYGSHDFQPSESYSDLNALRYLLYNKGVYDARSGDITPDQYKKAMSDPEIRDSFIFKRLRKNYSDDDIIKLNNTVAGNSSGQELSTAEDGGETGDPTSPPGTIRVGGRNVNANTAASIVKQSKKDNIDPYTALAIAYQESGIDKDNPFHLNPQYFSSNLAGPTAGVDNMKKQFAYATAMQKKGIAPQGEAGFIQGYNGYGKIWDDHADLEGAKSIYGVPIPKEGLDLRKNPMYGNRVLNVRERVFHADPDVSRFVDSVANTTYEQGGPVTDGELYHILGSEADDERMEYLKKGGWIQSANADIKRRGTKGVCTGSKFGSSSCPAGSRRYNLAKTFRAMAKHRKKHEEGGLVQLGEGGEIDAPPEHIIGLIGQGYDFDL